MPEDEETAKAVRNLSLDISGGPSGMREENIQAWPRAAIREESMDPSQWEMFVGIIQAAFCEGHLVEECAWKTVVLTPKGNINFCGIGFAKLL